MDNNSYDKLINRIIDKRYKIETVVGVGGMAYVLRAKDMTTGRDVAVKILSDEFKDDERAVKRFINESTTMRILSRFLTSSLPTTSNTSSWNLSTGSR